MVTVAVDGEGKTLESVVDMRISNVSQFSRSGSCTIVILMHGVGSPVLKVKLVVFDKKSSSSVNI